MWLKCSQCSKNWFFSLLELFSISLEGSSYREWTVLQAWYLRRDNSGATLRHISISDAVNSRHVEGRSLTTGISHPVFLPFVVTFKSAKLRNFDL